MSCLICQIRFQIETLHLMMHKRVRWRQFLNCDEDDRSTKYAGVPAASNREAALIPGPGGRGGNCESSEELSREQGTRTPVSSCLSITARATADMERKMGYAAREVGFRHTAGQGSASGLERIWRIASTLDSIWAKERERERVCVFV